MRRVHCIMDGNAAVFYGTRKALRSDIKQVQCDKAFNFHIYVVIE